MKKNYIYLFFYTFCVVVVILLSVEKVLSLDISSWWKDSSDQHTVSGVREAQSENKITIPEYPKSSRLLNQNGRIGVGAFIKDIYGTKFQSVLDFEDLVDKKLEYIHLFRAWGDEDKNFPKEELPYLKSLNLVPIITWEPWKRNFDSPEKIQSEYTLESIAIGSHDEYIKTWAWDTKEAGIRIIIRFAHEMSTPTRQKVWYPWQGESENYKSAFQRIVRIFRSEGATNVEFMWSPLVYDLNTSIDGYYPGDDYVDVIGFSVINLGETIGKKDIVYHWQECSHLLPLQLKAAQGKNKPIIVAELLSSESGGDKGNWYTQCLNLIEQDPRIVGVLVNQSFNDTTWSAYPIDWGVNSSKKSLTAFKDAVRHELFK